MLDFKEVKTIRITDVVGRYGVALKFKGEWACGVCPLPTHKPGDKSRTFTVNIAGNYWRCFSESCNANNGGKKGGDVINFVALMENCREREAAQKLASWFHIGTSSSQLSPQIVTNRPANVNQTKTAQRMAERSSQEVRNPSERDLPDNNKSTIEGKVGYMQAVGLWFDTFIVRQHDEADDAYLKRIKKGFMAQLHQSFLNGKRGREELTV